MKIKILIIGLIIMLTTALNVEAAQFPKPVKDYLITQKKVPTVRFDGMVIYNKDVMYLPVYPAYPEKTEEVKIIKTYPENLTMDKLPDLVLFNNNFSLIKLIKTQDGGLTVKNLDWPVEVKTGLLPQNIVVPKGLVLPESLAGIIGDVQIPLVGSAKKDSFITRKTVPLPTGKKSTDTKITNVPVELKNKLFFVNNFQTEYLQVFSSTVSEALYSLKTSGVMKDVKPVLNGQFLLIATSNKKNIDVVDVKSEYVAKNIDLTAIPSEIAVDDTNQKAYVASIKDESLTVIDLNTMSVKEKIQLAGSPQKLSISQDGKQIAYSDLKTSNIYILDLENNCENKLITNYPNVTKIILKKGLIYMIARTNPSLRIVQYDLLQDNKTVKTKKEKRKEAARKKDSKDNSELIGADIFTDYDLIAELNEQKEDSENMKMYATSTKDITVGNKPVDICERNNNVYVLCAGDNSVYAYNGESGNVTVEKLPVDGFSKAFTPVPSSDIAIITNMSELKYVVYDMKKSKSIKTIPINDYVNMITILERTNEQ